MRIVGWSLAALLAGATACSSGDSDGKAGDGGGDADASSGGNDGAGADGSDGPGADDGTNDGSNDGTAGSAGDGTSGDGGAPVCDEFAINAKPTVPNMLIVLDRSGSMITKDKNGNVIVDRWTPSVAALKALTADLETQIRFGLMTFPSDPTEDCSSLYDPNNKDPWSTCEGCVPGEVSVQPAVGTATKIATKLDATKPKGGTPTSASLDEARTKFAQLPIDPDAPPAPNYVLLVTDGAPSCPNGAGTRTPDGDRSLAVTSIENLKSDGVKTYVVSYDDALDASFMAALTEFAQAGGTNDYYTVNTVDDQAALLAVFKKIAGSIVPCSYELETQPSDPSYVLVKLDGKQLNLNGANGWSIQDKTVTLEGDACKTLQNGETHQLSVKVLCEIVAPI